VCCQEGHDPLNVCLSHNRRFLSDEILETLDTLQVLVSFGAAWDAKCDELVSSGKARNEALALRICMILWTQERADGLPFTNIPLEVIERGTDSTQAYIDNRKSSSAIVLRRKICLVGSSCAGKTSLIKSIISEQPQLEHVDDRTIGIDQFSLRFSESNIGSDGKRKIHEVTFWDFAGQDVYQVAHSLFFSRRTLYLVCVDIAAFTVAYKQAVIFADHDFQETKLLDEFVEDSAMRWVRMIVARQPDAEFVFIATKEDAHGDNKVTEELLKGSLMDKLKQVNTTVQQMKEPKEKSTRAEHDSSVGLMGWWKKGATAVQWMADQYKTENQDHKGCVSVASSDPTVVFVSCTSRALTREARIKIRDLVIKSGYSFEMPDTYTRVLKEIKRIRDEAKTTLIGTRISRVFARAESLPAILNVETDVCRTILQTLHDLGDVLWYEDLGVALLGNIVVLEPLLLIDFIRQVFDHRHTDQILPHADLKGKPYWVALDASNAGHERRQMEAMKQVLQAFHLVYSADEYRVMKWNSDLIVPAFWQTKPPAAWLFLGDILRISTTRTCEGEAVRVHWEYHFESGLPPAFFDHVVVASVSPDFTFAAGPDWIMYKEDEVAACRIMVGRDPKSLHRTIDVEAVVAETANEDQVEMLWETFKQLCAAFVTMLRENPGLKVSSFAWTDKAGKKNMDDLLWSPLKRPPGKWMPPAETWGWLKRLATGQDRTRTIEEGWEGDVTA
jgi:GTPase SAR1 family protein